MQQFHQITYVCEEYSNSQDSKSIFMITDFNIFSIMLLRQLNFSVLLVSQLFYVYYKGKTPLFFNLQFLLLLSENVLLYTLLHIVIMLLFAYIIISRGFLSPPFYKDLFSYWLLHLFNLSSNPRPADLSFTFFPLLINQALWSPEWMFIKDN